MTLKTLVTTQRKANGNCGDTERQQATWGFAIVGLDVRTISSGKHPSFGSGRTSDIGH